MLQCYYFQIFYIKITLKIEKEKEVLNLMKKIPKIIHYCWFGVMAMTYSLLLSALTSMIINSWPNKKLLGYSFKG